VQRSADEVVAGAVEVVLLEGEEVVLEDVGEDEDSIVSTGDVESEDVIVAATLAAPEGTCLTRWCPIGPWCRRDGGSGGSPCAKRCAFGPQFPSLRDCIKPKYKKRTRKNNIL